jgi:hypothetical protein
MTCSPWLARATFATVLLFAIGCGQKTHLVGIADASIGPQGTGGTPGQGGSGGTMAKDGPVETSGNGVPGSGGTGNGGTGVGGKGVGGSTGNGGKGGTAMGGKPGTGGVIRNGGAPGSGGVSAVDGGRPPQNPACCNRDEACMDGFECVLSDSGKDGVCENLATLTPGQCWRASDCHGSTGGCRAMTICPCGAFCAVADRPGVCVDSEGTGGAPGTGGRSGGGGAGGTLVDGGRACPNPGDGHCCFLDEDCREGFACIGATCTVDRQEPGVCEYLAGLAPGQCWRDSDCPDGNRTCVGTSICPCLHMCNAPDGPGTCQ